MNNPISIIMIGLFVGYSFIVFLVMPTEDTTCTAKIGAQVRAMARSCKEVGHFTVNGENFTCRQVIVITDDQLLDLRGIPQ